MIDLLVFALLLGLGGLFVAATFRATLGHFAPSWLVASPWSAGGVRWLVSGVASCDLCSSFWSTLAFVLWLRANDLWPPAAFFVVPAAVGIALVLLTITTAIRTAARAVVELADRASPSVLDRECNVA